METEEKMDEMEMNCDTLLGVHTGRQKRIQQQSDRDGEDIVLINYSTQAYISVKINQSIKANRNSML